MSCGSPSASVSSTSGNRARNVAIASGIRVAPAVGNEAIRKPAAADARDRCEGGLGRLQAGDDALGVLDEQLAGRGQPQAARPPLDQRRLGLGLQRRDLLGDGRLRVRQRLGGRRERPAVGDFPQDPEAIHVEH